MADLFFDIFCSHTDDTYLSAFVLIPGLILVVWDHETVTNAYLPEVFSAYGHSMESEALHFAAVLFYFSV